MKAALMVVAGILLLATYVAGDCYLQNPRGSNDRLNGAGTNRDNDNRLFDSQNNAKGGYCYGPSMSFYEGSLLTIEWTNQHGCGIGKLQCNLVMQYMCGLTSGGDESVQIRDGTTETTIPNDPNTYNDKDANGDYKYGMHEPYSYYDACQTRSRNKGLFVADRITRGNLGDNTAATHTRQNNGGTRRGFECSEERDYYPYWHPTPWKDINIFADNTKWCDLFQKESQNVQAKGQCLDSDGNPVAENTPRSCSEKNEKWVETASWGLPPPECQLSPYNRDNHLGNAAGQAQTNMYNWTLPTKDTEDCIKDDNCNCVFRIRYNISSGDVDGWGFMDSQFNGESSPVHEDPDVPVSTYNLSLAIDTTQFFRTFQDRSHVFHIRPRPDGVSAVARIFNLNVRGKRGNIVEAYPATEYDFTPNNLEVRVGDYVHFQWTGCDTNPAGNAGEGRDGTDRSNIVQISDLSLNYPATDDWLSSHQPMFESADLRFRMAYIDQDMSQCLDRDGLDADTTTDEDDNVRNCYKLNAASPYFDGGLVRMNNTGEFYYMNTRNNNFTNRGQKGTLTISPLLPVWGIVLTVVGAATFVGAGAVTALKLYSNSHAGSGVAKFFDKI